MSNIKNKMTYNLLTVPSNQISLYFIVLTQLINIKNKFMSYQTSQQKILKAQGHYTTDLVSLDFKSQSLQKFLESVVAIVNQHSYKINQLQFDKVSIETTTNGNNKISNSINVTNPTLINQITLKKDIATDDKYLQSIQKICQKLQYYNQSIDLIYRNQSERDLKVNGIEKKIQDLVNNQTLKQRTKRVKQQSKVYTDEQINKLLARVKDVQQKTNKKIGDFQNLTKQVQKKTLWKITECQASLGKKVTEQYVERAMSQLQQKIIRDQKNSKNNETADLKFQLQNFSRNYDVYTRDADEKAKLMRKAIKQLEEQVKTFQKKEKIENDKRQSQTKLKEQIFRIDRLEKREDPIDLEMRLTKPIGQNNQRILDVNKRLKHLEQQFESTSEMLSSMKGGEGGNDPHKICHMDAEIKRLKDNNRTNQSKIGSLEEQLKTKLLIFEERISSSLAMMRNQQNNVSRQQMYDTINRLKQPFNSRFNDHQNLLNEIGSKMQKLQLFQKVTKKKIKDLTKGQDFNKILDLKLNISEAKVLLDTMDMKIQNLQVYYNKLKMQIDANTNYLREIHQKIGGVQEGFSIISNKQKIFPAKCLACGIKHLPHKQPGQMQGSDGKFYRVDIKNTCMYDQDQVFDVVPSQITLIQTAKKDSRISSAKGRRQQIQSTGYTGFRPQSAKKI